MFLNTWSLQANQERSMLKKSLFFRADGNSKIGLGHVVRTLALMDILREDFNCTFVSRNLLPNLKQQAKQIAHKIIILPETDDNVAEAHYLVETFLTGQEIVILDGYHFKWEYQKVLKSKGCQLVCIDDNHAYRFLADVIINHGGGIKAINYTAEPYTLFYLGLEYMLLRRPFLEAAQKNDPLSKKEENAVFICMGGSDPQNDTLKILKACEKKKDISKFYLILGEGYKNQEEINTFLKQTPLNVSIFKSQTASQMVEIMKRCPLAICAPSSIAYEYLTVGGSLFLHQTADNQTFIYQYLIQNHYAQAFEAFNTEGVKLLKPTKKIGTQSVENLKKIFYTLNFETTLQVRKANKADLLLCFNWANDPATRAQSFSSTLISLEEHTNWFLKKIADTNSCFYIVYSDGKPIGQIRFDFKNNEALISFALDAAFRGKGLGQLLLRKGIQEVTTTFGAEKKFTTIVGFVKQSNQQSNKAFLRLGFQQSVSSDFEESYKYVKPIS